MPRRSSPATGFWSASRHSPAKDFEGKVTRTSWTLDAKNRTLRTEIDVPNPEGTLRPGLYAYATIIVEEHPDALSVPTSALVRQDSQTYCVAVVDGKASASRSRRTG